MSIFDKIKNKLDPKKNGVADFFKGGKKKIEGELKKAEGEIDKNFRGIKKLLESKEFIKELKDLFFKLLPKDISPFIFFAGSGIQPTWEAEKDIKKIRDLIKAGKYDEQVLWTIVPSSLSVTIGGTLALLLEVSIGTTATFDTRDDIMAFAKLVKKVRNKLK